MGGTTTVIIKHRHSGGGGGRQRLCCCCCQAGGGGARNLPFLPGDNEVNDGWGDGINEGAMAELILGVSHDQSRFAPGSTTILTLVDRPLLDADGEG